MGGGAILQMILQDQRKYSDRPQTAAAGTGKFGNQPEGRESLASNDSATFEAKRLAPRPRPRDISEIDSLILGGSN